MQWEVPADRGQYTEGVWICGLLAIHTARMAASAAVMLLSGSALSAIHAFPACALPGHVGQVS